MKDKKTLNLDCVISKLEARNLELENEIRLLSIYNSRINNLEATSSLDDEIDLLEIFKVAWQSKWVLGGVQEKCKKSDNWSLKTQWHKLVRK